MSALSEVSVLIGQRARDIEKARQIFTAEIRSFTTGILSVVRQTRSDPWVASKVRLDLPREIENEAKATSDFSSQYAVARTEIRFRKGVRFVQIAEVRFGIEFDESASAFAWQVVLVPAAKYNRVDDVVWNLWRTQQPESPGARHLDKANAVRFVSRPLGSETTGENAFNDAKGVLEFLLGADVGTKLGEAVGLDLAPGEE